MKNLIITITLLGFGFVSEAQIKDQPVQKKDTTQTEVIKLTDWQLEQIVTIEQQQKVLEERKQFLLITIMDANKVDHKRVTAYEIKERDLIVGVRKSLK